jgi:hypothetical protein
MLHLGQGRNQCLFRTLVALEHFRRKATLAILPTPSSNVPYLSVSGLPLGEPAYGGLPPGVMSVASAVPQ